MALQQWVVDGYLLALAAMILQNAVGRTSALTAVACVGLIAAGPMTDTSFARLLQVAAALYLLGAVVAAVTITNPAAAVENLRGSRRNRSGEVAAR